MQIKFTKEHIYSDKKQKDYYMIKYVLVDEYGSIVSKSDALMFVTKEVYDKLNF